MKGEKPAKKKNPLYRRVSPPHEQFIKALLFIAASAAVLISLAIIYTLLSGSISFFTDPAVSLGGFLTGSRWVPSGTHPSFGIWPLLSGTILVAGGALLIGGPVGVGGALYLSEYAGERRKRYAKPVIEVLAGIPSVVYGFFALMVISPIFREYFGATYFNAASAIIVMSVMVLPIIVSISDDSLRAVPRHLRRASLAVGATKWETTIKVVMPAASSGIIASILLALGRAIGETMVVTLAAGSIARLTLNPLGEVQTMTAYIAQVATGDIPPGVSVDAAFAVGLLLFVLTYIVNLVAAGVVEGIKNNSGGNRSKACKAFGVLWGVFSRIRFSGGAPSLKCRHRKNHVGRILTGFCLVLAGGFLMVLLASVLKQGLPGLSTNFLTNFPSSRPERTGIYPVILGSTYLVLLTLVFTVPVGVGAAIYLTEIAEDRRHTRFLRRIIHNLAGVPSIVFGLVGLAIFSRMMGFGASLLSGSLTLSIMVLPVIVVSTEEALKSIPESFRLAAVGMGATRWQSIKHHVLPNAIPGILTGCILALSRAIGETAPILFIGALFSKTAPNSLLDGFLALPLTIFYWTRHPKQEFHVLAATTILVLLAILLVLNSAAVFIRNRTLGKRRW